MSPLLRHILMAVVLIMVLFGLEVGFEYIVPDAAWRQLALFAMVNVIVALSLNIINGMAGQFSIGHAGFVGIGAYTGAVVAGNLHQRLGTSEILFQNSFLVIPPALGAVNFAALPTAQVVLCVALLSVGLITGRALSATD